MNALSLSLTDWSWGRSAYSNQPIDPTSQRQGRWPKETLHSNINGLKRREIVQFQTCSIPEYAVANHQRLQRLKSVEWRRCDLRCIETANPQVFHIWWKGVEFCHVSNNMARWWRGFASKTQIVLQTKGINGWRERKKVTWRLNGVHPLEAIHIELDSTERQSRDVCVNQSANEYSPNTPSRYLWSIVVHSGRESMREDLSIYHFIQSDFSLSMCSYSRRELSLSSFDHLQNLLEGPGDRVEWTAVSASLCGHSIKLPYSRTQSNHSTGTNTGSNWLTADSEGLRISESDQSNQSVRRMKNYRNQLFLFQWTEGKEENPVQMRYSRQTRNLPLRGIWVWGSSWSDTRHRFVYGSKDPLDTM